MQRDGLSTILKNDPLIAKRFSSRSKRNLLTFMKTLSRLILSLREKTVGRDTLSTEVVFDKKYRSFGERFTSLIKPKGS